jgi:hypothetical protein
MSSNDSIATEAGPVNTTDGEVSIEQKELHVAGNIEAQDTSNNDNIIGGLLRSQDPMQWNQYHHDDINDCSNRRDSITDSSSHFLITNQDQCNSDNTNNDASMGDCIFRSKSLLDNDSSDDDDDGKDESINDNTTISRRSDIDGVFRKSHRVEDGKINDDSFTSTMVISQNYEKNFVHNYSVNSERPVNDAFPFGMLKPSNTWDGFVRQGARFKNLFDDAMSEVKTSLSFGGDTGDFHSSLKKRLLVSDDVPANERKISRRRVNHQEIDLAAKLAREKTAESLNLQRVSSEKHGRNNCI